MIPSAVAPSAFLPRVSALSASPLGRAVSIVVFAAIPAVTVVVLFWTAAADDAIAFDFRPFHRAAEAILAGESPYPGQSDPLTAEAGPYVYPPLPALLTVPLSWLAFDATGLLVMLCLLGAVPATLWAIGVTDWRCYGLALLWPPVLSAIQTGNVTLALGLVAALGWRFRDRALAGGALVGVTFAVKLFLWPLAVWFAATRRLAAAGVALVVGGALLVASWAVIGFDGLGGYPDLLERLEDTVGADSYTAYIVGLDLGLPSDVARGVWLGLGLGLLAATVVLARRDERTGFMLAIAAALALTPIVWLHYFALLLVPVALARPRLGPIWFVPLLLVVTPGSGQPAPAETAWTLAVAAGVLVWAVRESRARTRAELASPARLRTA